MIILDLGIFLRIWANQIVFSFLNGLCKTENLTHFLCISVCGLKLMDGVWWGLDIIWLHYMVTDNGFEFWLGYFKMVVSAQQESTVWWATEQPVSSKVSTMGEWSELKYCVQFRAMHVKTNIKQLGHIQEKLDRNGEVKSGCLEE